MRQEASLDHSVVPNPAGAYTPLPPEVNPENVSQSSLKLNTAKVIFPTEPADKSSRRAQQVLHRRLPQALTSYYRWSVRSLGERWAQLKVEPGGDSSVTSEGSVSKVGVNALAPVSRVVAQASLKLERKGLDFETSWLVS